MIAANLDAAMAEAVTDLTRREEPFAFATVIRTAGATAAKPGTKALLSAEGEILSGWLGGGCTRAAVRKATLEALADGQPKLVSVAPEDVLARGGVAPGMEKDGVRFARNGCPSQGTVDIFIEPSLPAPELVIMGGSPVAQALKRLAGSFHWDIRRAEPDEPLPTVNKRRCVVVATQGQGDRDALRHALDAGAEYIGFIGSSRKFAALSERLVEEGCAAADLSRVRAPAGLNIGAVTPDEIALSLLAELIEVRRREVSGDE